MRSTAHVAVVLVLWSFNLSRMKLIKYRPVV